MEPASPQYSDDFEETLSDEFAQTSTSTFFGADSDEEVATLRVASGLGRKNSDTSVCTGSTATPSEEVGHVDRQSQQKEGYQELLTDEGRELDEALREAQQALAVARQFVNSPSLCEHALATEERLPLRQMPSEAEALFPVALHNWEGQRAFVMVLSAVSCASSTVDSVASRRPPCWTCVDMDASIRQSAQDWTSCNVFGRWPPERGASLVARSSMASLPVLKTVVGPDGGISTQAEEPTSLMVSTGVAMAGGAAAGGGLAFLLCTSKCPGGVKGALSGMIGAMNPFSMLMKKDEKDALEEEEEEDSMKKMEKQVDTIEKELCNMNCKMAGLLGGAAGAAAGNVVAKQVNKQEAEGGGLLGGGGGGGGGFKLQMLDEWNAPQFFVLTKQIDNLQRDLRSLEPQSCEAKAAQSQHTETRRSQAKFDFF
ncbi:unnamed protein product [Symbiodinium microadriaticum]|nr:unnamed protein product [Symbiodinium microadriaticum]